MAKISNGKTKVVHVVDCADEVLIDGFTALELLECHGMRYVANLGFPLAQQWLDDSPMTKAVR